MIFVHDIGAIVIEDSWHIFYKWRFECFVVGGGGDDESVV